MIGPTKVVIETYSRLPKTPIGPPRLRNILIAFLLSLMAGIGLAFLLDFLDDTVKSIEDVDRYLHLPALALIPASRGERGRLMGLGSAPRVQCQKQPPWRWWMMPAHR